MTPPPSILQNAHPRGMALIVTLSLIVLLSVLVVGFTVTARFDRTLSSGYSKADRTELVAQSSMNHARALLASNIPDVGPNAPAAPTHWWVAPGRLWTQAGNSSPTAVNLYSGESTSADDPNLNRRRIDGTFPIEPGGTPMRVAWIPIGKNPSLAVSATNPMVARFAYWIDVENTRINLRAARRGSGVPSELAVSGSSYVPAVNRSTGFVPAGSVFGGLAPGSPGVVDISGLPGAGNVTGLPDPTGNMQISNTREYRQFFASDATWNTFFNANQFDISVWGESPEFTALGKNRMSTVQYRNKSLPGFQFYWDLDDPNQILASPMNMGPGTYPPPNSTVANEFAYYQRSARALAAAFQSTEWPGYSGSSLAAKWTARGGLPAADSNKVAEQVAWNAVTAHGFLMLGGSIRNEVFGLGRYGRIGAGTDLETQAKGDLFPSVSSSSTGDRYLAQSGNPFVTELGLQLNWETAGANKNVRLRLVGELFTGSQVRIADVSTLAGTDAGILLRDSASATTGVYLIPTAVSFEIPAASTTVTAGSAAFPGWTVAASGANLVFTLANPNPLLGSGNWTPSGRNRRLSAEPTPLAATTLRLPANSFQAFRSEDVTAPSAVTPSLLIPLVGSATSVTLSNVRMKVLAVKEPSNIDQYKIFQYCPLQDSSLVSGSLLTPSAQDPLITLGSMTIAEGETNRAYTAEVNDPRRCSLSDAWAVCSNAGTTFAGTNTLGAVNSNWPATLPDIRALGFVTLSGTPSATGYYTTNPGDLGIVYSPGQLANLWTAPPYLVPATGDLYLNLTSSDTGIPDHLALELINTEPGMTLGSNQGTINPNTRIYPSSWGIPSRTKALDALFRRWRIGGTNVNAAALASSIASNMPADGYRYRGELIPHLETGGGVLGAAATKWEKQALLSALAGRLTTQASSFGVWGVAQTVQQSPSGTISVTGEKRFFGVIRRRPYTGVDGVYGNAQSDASGAFTKTTIGGSGFTGPLFGLMRDIFDGPDPVPVPNPASVAVPDETSPSQTVRAAFNPLKSYLTTETSYFEYLDP